jgi:hypothetical protein
MTAAYETLLDCCQAALSVLDRVLEEPPERMTGDLPEAVRGLVCVRDWLIARRRAEPGAGDVQERLDRTNAILSVVTGGEYPLVGVRRQRIVEARDALRQLADSL